MIFSTNVASRLDFPPAPPPFLFFHIYAPLFYFWILFFACFLALYRRKKRGLCFSSGTSNIMYCILCPALCIVYLIMYCYIQYVWGFYSLRGFCVCFGLVLFGLILFCILFLFYTYIARQYFLMFLFLRFFKFFWFFYFLFFWFFYIFWFFNVSFDCILCSYWLTFYIFFLFQFFSLILPLQFSFFWII